VLAQEVDGHCSDSSPTRGKQQHNCVSGGQFAVFKLLDQACQTCDVRARVCVNLETNKRECSFILTTNPTLLPDQHPLIPTNIPYPPLLAPSP
jgi:type VI protein secretion system component VasK